MNRLYYLNHSPIDFYFSQNARDFVVTEIPLYEFSGEGEHLILKVRKKGLTTWQMIQAISEQSGVKVRDIGYAGLKDKEAMTIQYISINKKFEDKLENFSHESIKILERFYHKNKIKIGHLKGNKFFIRLKKVNPVSAKQIGEAIKNISKFGMPNYFGFQRFGRDGNNYEVGKEIIEGKKNIRNRKEREFLINSYQSHLFNLWLSKRVEVNKLISSFNEKELVDILNLSKEEVKLLKSQIHPFKLLRGDLANHYPYGRVFEVENYEEQNRFLDKEIVPTGLLSGKKQLLSEDLAYGYEKEFVDENITANGARRFAWIFPSDIENSYKESEFWYELHFFLPKGSYATVLLEEIAHKEIR